MTPMTLIIVSAVADGNTRGATTSTRANVSHGDSALSLAVMTRAFP